MNFEELKRKVFLVNSDDGEEMRSTADQIARYEEWLAHSVTRDFFDRVEAETSKQEGPVDAQFAAYAVGFRDAMSAVQKIRRDYERFIRYERD